MPKCGVIKITLSHQKVDGRFWVRSGKSAKLGVWGFVKFEENE